eukprot:scaffold602932_cov24-Prasinocladus_malaysianus.AAC.1
MVEVFMGQSPSDFVEEGPSRYGTKAANWIRVNESDALGEVLQRPDYVVPGVPVFFVVAKDTEFRRKFLANETNAQYVSEGLYGWATPNATWKWNTISVICHIPRT